MSNHNIIYSYRGAMSNAILNNILNTMASKMAELGDKPPNIKKVNSVLIECCQNLIHHAEYPQDSGNGAYLPSLSVAREGQNYAIITGNLVTADNAKRLKAYIDRINEMSKEELREYYQTVLTNGEISEHGGGGLGILKIIRKTVDSKLEYAFEQLSADKLYFTMNFVV